MSKVVIYGGGTFTHVRNHLALAAPAFGTTARYLKQLLPYAELRLTRMASESSKIVTLEDLRADIEEVLCDKWVKFIVMNAAICDFTGAIGSTPSGKHAARLQSRSGVVSMSLIPVNKIIDRIKRVRPDIKIVGFKTTVNSNRTTQIHYAERMDVWAVIANDLGTRNNMLVNAGIVTEDDRNTLLQDVAYRIQLEQSQVLYENDNVVVVDLKPKGYLSRTDALSSAINILGSKYSGITFDEWSASCEGVALFRKERVCP